MNREKMSRSEVFLITIDPPPIPVLVNWREGIGNVRGKNQKQIRSLGGSWLSSWAVTAAGCLSPICM